MLFENYHQEIIELNKPKEEFISDIKKYLEIFKRKIVQESNNWIDIITGNPYNYIWEEIKIQFLTDWKVSISSQDSLTFRLFDREKNERNVKKLINQLNNFQQTNLTSSSNPSQTVS